MITPRVKTVYRQQIRELEQEYNCALPIIADQMQQAEAVYLWYFDVRDRGVGTEVCYDYQYREGSGLFVTANILVRLDMIEKKYFEEPHKELVEHCKPALRKATLSIDGRIATIRCRKFSEKYDYRFAIAMYPKDHPTYNIERKIKSSNS
jgi:hypothetical protein